MFANEKRERLRAMMAEFFCDIDALLMPVAVVPAIPHDQSEPFADRLIRSNGGSRPYTDMMGWMARPSSRLVTPQPGCPWVFRSSDRI